MWIVLVACSGVEPSGPPDSAAVTADSAGATVDSGDSDRPGDTAESDSGEPATEDLPEIEGMAAIPAGSFRMGCEAEGECFDDETPIREVNVSAYYIDLAEVSQDEWKKCISAKACTQPECNFNQQGWDDYPVICISRTEAADYCAWEGKRLPTEAEWEKAARGTDARRYPWGADEPTCKLANFIDCGNEMKNVGGRDDGKSPYGAFDMAGNVGEWVADWYASDAYSTQPDTDPVGPSTGTQDVWRGGTCEEMAFSLRTWGRNTTTHGDRSMSYVGFRCASSPSGD